jgi:predicted nucleic acid-binding protein
LQLVVADTGPINYLVLIGRIDILPVLFEHVILPTAVRNELAQSGAPSSVQKWIASPPPWVEVKQRLRSSLGASTLDLGEEEAIDLAVEIHADMILMDDRDGVAVARSKGIEVTGTLGVLAMAAREGLINLGDAFEQIKRTNFRYRQEIMDQLLVEASRNS